MPSCACISYLPSHLVTRDRNKEEMSAIRIVRPKPTLSDILKEITLARILSRQLPRRLVECVGISIWIYKHLEIPLHLLVIPPKHLRRVIHRISISTSDSIRLICGRQNLRISISCSICICIDLQIRSKSKPPACHELGNPSGMDKIK